MQNYFSIFDLKTDFEIDKIKLEQQYKEQIAQFHPDKFANSTADEKSQALQNTSLINTAYNTLKSDLNRAIYLLELNNIYPFDEKDTQMDAEFLITQIELREKLETLKNETEVEEFIDKINPLEKQHIQNIKESFKMNNLENAKKNVRELRFYQQLILEANKLLDELL
ncbi:Chaperone protein HscB [hydrothermal vent metagenome]|uniref:Chaperone protein HscB n=1 Tax=hydrothermal vent metagenome TaxID=652676 RepID=A0A1W1C547_9ZZZZ